jgi:hypothetical protein
MILVVTNEVKLKSNSALRKPLESAGRQFFAPVLCLPCG